MHSKISKENVLAYVYLTALTISMSYALSSPLPFAIFARRSLRSLFDVLRRGQALRTNHERRFYSFFYSYGSASHRHCQQTHLALLLALGFLHYLTFCFSHFFSSSPTNPPLSLSRGILSSFAASPIKTRFSPPFIFSSYFLRGFSFWSARFLHGA